MTLSSLSARLGLVISLFPLTVLLALSGPGRVEEAPGTAPVPTPSDAVQTVLDSMRDRHGFPGATAAYAWTEGPSGGAATGLADVEAERPMTTDARMLAASIGKTVVGATAAALAHEGELDLDAPVAQWLGDRPWFSRLPHHDRITMRHLLTHQSGLPDHVHLDAFADTLSRRWSKPGPPLSPEQLIQLVTDRPARFEPGEGWSYSDTGYLLAGLVIEAVTGRDYYDVIQDRFLQPLSLQSTRPSNRRDLPGLATGYAADTPLGLPTRTTTTGDTMAWHPGLEWTGGGLVSTSGDLARWGAALFGGQALPDPALDRMLNTVPIDPSQPSIRYGLGVAFHRGGPFGPVYGHGGWIPGYTSSLRYYADHGVAIAFQINTDIGLETDTSSVVQDLETRLAEVVLKGEPKQRSGKRPSHH